MKARPARHQATKRHLSFSRGEYPFTYDIWSTTQDPLPDPVKISRVRYADAPKRFVGLPTSVREEEFAAYGRDTALLDFADFI